METEERIKNEITTYPWDVLEGKIIACNYVKLACQRFINFLNRDDLYFDVDAVLRVIDFCHKFKHFSGKHNGKNFELLDWQKFVACGAYGFHKKDGTRLTHSVYISVSRKQGKALDINTPIPTPHGFVTMGDLEEGDYVYDENGKPTMVTGVTPVMYNHKCYRVTFEDFSSIIADADHNWSIWDRFKESEKVMTTQEIVDAGLGRCRSDNKGFEYRFRVPMTKPVEGTETELPFDPYVFGVWLADGAKAKPQITEDKRETFIIDKVCARIGMYSTYHDKKDSNGRDYRFRQETGFNPFLKAYDFKNKGKYIPEIYLNASISQRMELLQGIMDGDGYIDERGQIEISQVNHRLAEDIIKLVSGLGMKISSRTKIPKLYGRECKEVIRMTFFTDKTRPCFTLPRKYERLKDNLNKRMLRKTITKIEPVESVPVKCIVVDSPNHLYLAGINHTVTHNSAMVAALFGLFGLIADGEYEAQVILSANSFQQAQILYKFCNLYLKSLGSKVDKLFKRYRDSIKFPSTESILKCVAADASKLDGFGPSIAILDELHEAPDSSMYDVMQSGQGARENPMIVAITTAGFNTFGFCANMERKNIEMLYGTRQDDSTFALIYTLDEGDDWTDENVWIKSNPSMGYTVKKEFIAEQIQKALNDPVAEIAVKTKNLNIWCDSSTSWIGSDYILSASKKVNLNDYQYSNAYIGLDLASVDDLSAVSVLIPNGDEFIFKNFAFVPEEMLKKSANKERYKRWIGRGELIVTPGNVTDYDYIINKIKEVCNVLSVVQIAYDSWNSTQAVIKMTEDGLPCMPYSQSIGSMNRPTKEMKRLFMSHKIILDDNECTRFCFGNVVIKTDTNENEKATKLAYDNKIDICIAMIMALGSYLTTEHYDNIIIGTTN